jgi:hypothetical protein
MSNYSYESESLLDTFKNNKKTAIGILAFLIAFALLFFVVIPKIYAPETKQITDYNQIIRDNDIKRGKLDSNITVVIFEDPQCPSCQSLSKTESEKLEAFRDKVRFVYKYVRAVPGHTFSVEANSYIYAAEALKNKGYELVEKSYKTTTAPQSLTKSEFLGYATSEGLNLDQTAILEKANSKEIQSQVAQQQKDFEVKFPAIDGWTKAPMRINGTPGAVILKDGKLIRITTGSDREALVDQTKDFTAFSISEYLKEITQ